MNGKDLDLDSMKDNQVSGRQGRNVARPFSPIRPCILESSHQGPAGVGDPRILEIRTCTSRWVGCYRVVVCEVNFLLGRECCFQMFSICQGANLFFKQRLIILAAAPSEIPLWSQHVIHQDRCSKVSEATWLKMTLFFGRSPLGGSQKERIFWFFSYNF